MKTTTLNSLDDLDNVIGAEVLVVDCGGNELFEDEIGVVSNWKVEDGELLYTVFFPQLQSESYFMFNQLDIYHDEELVGIE